MATPDLFAPPAAAGECIIIEVDGRPVAKGRGKAAVINGRAMVYTPKKTREYENRIKDAAMRVMQLRPPLQGPVKVLIIAYVAIPEGFSAKNRDDAINQIMRPIVRPDIDNYVKAALDGINAIAIGDDNQVVDLYAAKRYAEHPRLRIEIKPLI